MKIDDIFTRKSLVDQSAGLFDKLHLPSVYNPNYIDVSMYHLLQSVH